MRFKDTTADYILRRLRIGPNHPVLGLSNRRIDDQHAAVELSFRTPDSSDPDRMFSAAFLASARPYRYSEVQTYEQFFLIAWRAICAFERHELLEGMRAQGMQVWLPHEPGGQGALTNPRSELFFLNRDGRSERTYPNGISEPEADRFLHAITVENSSVIRVTIRHLTELSAAILVEFEAEDSTCPGRRFHGAFAPLGFEYAAVRSDEQFFRIVYESVAAFNRHELLEQLRYRGERVWLAHRPGGIKGLTKPLTELFFLNREKRTHVQTQPSPHEGVTA